MQVSCVLIFSLKQQLSHKASLERSNCFINQFCKGIHSIILCIYSSNCILTAVPSQYFARYTYLYTWCPLFAVSHCHLMQSKASCRGPVCESCLFPESLEFAIQVFSVYALPLKVSEWKETAFYHWYFFLSLHFCMEKTNDQYNS